MAKYSCDSYGRYKYCLIIPGTYIRLVRNLSADNNIEALRGWAAADASFALPLGSKNKGAMGASYGLVQIDPNGHLIVAAVSLSEG